MLKLLDISEIKDSIHTIYGLTNWNVGIEPAINDKIKSPQI